MPQTSEQAQAVMDSFPPFYGRTDEATRRTLGQLDVLQVNVGRLCNLACRHCHMDAGPACTEVMARETLQQCLEVAAGRGFKTLDVTGGSPELHPDCEWFLREGAKLAEKVIVRTNLTLEEKPEYENFLDVFAEVGADVCVSLPYFDAENADNQRGRGVFKRAVANIRKLNERGYGREGGPELEIVYNVAGPFLPPPQELLADAYRVKLTEQQGIDFNELYAFNNFPLGRFAMDLADAGLTDDYLKLLHDNFNAFAVGKIMCRDQVNVDVDGRLYDCEVNHVLGLPLDGPRNVRDLVDEPLGPRTIATSPLCYSCAAGCGSSCGGSLMDKYGE